MLIAVEQCFNNPSAYFSGRFRIKNDTLHQLVYLGIPGIDSSTPHHKLPAVIVDIIIKTDFILECQLVILIISAIVTGFGCGNDSPEEVYLVEQQCWELVEKLLLSAQRQEGLRQMILEALDETSIGALRYMIGVIIEHKLTRFSSVVRAIDTWAGLGWETEKETTVRTIVGLAHQYLSHPESIPQAVKSKNNNEVYMALWVQGVLDVAKTAPYLHELMDKGTLEKKCLALQFVRQTGDPYLEMPMYFKALAEDNLQLLAFALVGMKPLLGANVTSKFYIDNPDYPHLLMTA